MPGKPFQSKLEPFYDFIRESRLNRLSYRQIAKILGSEHGLSVSANAIFSFVKVRTKRRKLYALPPADRPSPPKTNLHSLNAAGGFFTPPESPNKPSSYENKNRPYNI